MISSEDLGPVGYYNLLGLRYGSAIDQIPAAFRKTALKFHPDHQHDQQSEDHISFEIIQTARFLL